jgi:hypothetical protein
LVIGIEKGFSRTRFGDYLNPAKLETSSSASSPGVASTPEARERLGGIRWLSRGRSPVLLASLENNWSTAAGSAVVYAPDHPSERR